MRTVLRIRRGGGRSGSFDKLSYIADSASSATSATSQVRQCGLTVIEERRPVVMAQ